MFRLGKHRLLDNEALFDPNENFPLRRKLHVFLDVDVEIINNLDVIYLVRYKVPSEIKSLADKTDPDGYIYEKLDFKTELLLKKKPKTL